MTFLLLGCENVNLSSITLSDGELVPAFSQTIKRYTIEVENQIDSMSINAVNTNSNALMNIYSNRVLHSGNFDDNIALRPGQNTISITATKGNLVNTTDLEIKRNSDELEIIKNQLETNLSEVYEQANQNQRLLAGLNVAIFSPDYGTWSSSTGLNNINASSQLSTDSSIGVGSITKSFIAALALKLMEETEYGFSINDSITNWISASDLPAENIIDPTLTIKELLNHTSGIRDKLAAGQSVVELIDAILTSFLPHPNYIVKNYNEPAGEKAFSYANMNYTLVGVVLNKVLQKKNPTDSVSKALNRYFFKPLNLRHTHLTLEQPPRSLAKGHYFIDGKLIPVPAGIDVLILKTGNYAGSLVSTAEDMARWMEALFSRDEDGNSVVLSKISLDLMTTDENASGYGLGIFISPNAYYHSGSAIISSASVMYDRNSGESYAVLINQDDFFNSYSNGPQAQQLLDNFHAAYNVAKENLMF